MKRATKPVALDDVAAHNQRMWDRLAGAGIPYTRAQGTPPRTAAAKRRFLDPHDRLAGLPIAGTRVLALAGGGGWPPIPFAEPGAESTVGDISARPPSTVRGLAVARRAKVRAAPADMPDPLRFPERS